MASTGHERACVCTCGGRWPGGSLQLLNTNGHSASGHWTQCGHSDSVAIVLTTEVVVGTRKGAGCSGCEPRRSCQHCPACTHPRTAPIPCRDLDHSSSPVVPSPPPPPPPIWANRRRC